MNHTFEFSARIATFASALSLTVFVVACGHDSPIGPPTPSGATVLGGPPMTSAPPPPPGWKPQPVVPTSQQQAQDTILGYLKKTLQALPPGTTLNASGFGGATNTPPCKDQVNGTPSIALTTVGQLKLPSGTDVGALIATTADIWKSWGWYVMERDGFRKPNQFGYAADGYSLQIFIAAHEGHGPTLAATSPCFPANLPSDRSPFPTILGP